MVHYIYENLQDRSANHRPLMAKHKFDIFPEMSTDLYTHVLTLLIFSPIFPATKQNITQEALQVSLTLLKVLPISLLKSNHSLLPQIQSLPSNNPNTQTQCPCSYPEHSSSCTQNWKSPKYPWPAISPPSAPQPRPGLASEAWCSTWTEP